MRTTFGHNCAATIINEWWVLTVSMQFYNFSNDLIIYIRQGAICVVDYSTSTISILYASTYLRETGPNIIYAEKYIIHEKFNASNSYIHDIAVVKLKSPINIKLFDWKVKLAVKGAVYPSGMPLVAPGIFLKKS